VTLAREQARFVELYVANVAGERRGSRLAAGTVGPRPSIRLLLSAKRQRAALMFRDAASALVKADPMALGGPEDEYDAEARRSCV
jgi:hypothetical protein